MITGLFTAGPPYLQGWNQWNWIATFVVHGWMAAEDLKTTRSCIWQAFQGATEKHICFRLGTSGLDVLSGIEWHQWAPLGSAYHQTPVGTGHPYWAPVGNRHHCASLLGTTGQYQALSTNGHHLASLVNTGHFCQTPGTEYHRALGTTGQHLAAGTTRTQISS